MANLEVIAARMGADTAQGGLHTFINPYSYLKLRDEVDLLARFDRIMIDGIFLVILFRLLGFGGVKRISFDMTSLAPIVFKDAVKVGQRVYMIGTTENNIAAAVRVISTRFPQLDILGFRSGYFENDEERVRAMKNIRDSGAEIVIAGMGVVNQERFLSELKMSGWSGTGFTCGGFFHQTASGIQYYPGWVDRLNLRWMYRVWDEPKLFFRYFFDYPKAVFFLFKDFLYLKLGGQ